MAAESQRRAVEGYRQRLRDRGLCRFEVLGLETDRELLRSLARRLGENDAAAGRLRAELARIDRGEGSGKGGVLAALLRAPRIHNEVETTREWAELRDVDL